jgi:hypothetical protein
MPAQVLSGPAATTLHGCVDLCVRGRW